MILARLIADSPTLKAAVGTDDPPTVQGDIRKYGPLLNSANLLLVTDARGRVMATMGDASTAARLLAGQPAVRNALAGKETISLLPQPNGILQVVTVPISLFLTQPQILGTLSAGFLLNDTLAAQLKEITGSDVAFGMDGRILATTLSREDDPVLAARLSIAGVSTATIGGDEYAVLPRPLRADTTGGPVALILRSRTEQLRSLKEIQTGLAVTAIVAVLLATLLSFAVARTITRPLAAITDVMREVAHTGDLTRKIALGEGRRWHDEDAQLMASTFNTLTDSIAKFQREMSQKERLSSLGRLSTVIAHDVRNPLMIIKGSLHALRQEEPERDRDARGGRRHRRGSRSPEPHRERGARFRASDSLRTGTGRPQRAVQRVGHGRRRRSGAGAIVQLDLDPMAATITTDAERLRMALVNMLVNARHAVNGASSPATEATHPGTVTLTTRTGGDRVTIVVSDTGAGIDPAHLTNVFDPYFTTKRGGTGLGLPISKNIIEGLGGTITIDSAPGSGTAIRIDLPYNSSAA